METACLIRSCLRKVLFSRLSVHWVRGRPDIDKSVLWLTTSRASSVGGLRLPGQPALLKAAQQTGSEWLGQHPR